MLRIWGPYDPGLPKGCGTFWGGLIESCCTAFAGGRQVGMRVHGHLLRLRVPLGPSIRLCLKTRTGSSCDGKRPSASSSVVGIFANMPSPCVLASGLFPSQSDPSEFSDRA